MAADLRSLEQLVLEFAHRGSGVAISGRITEVSTVALTVSGISRFASLGDFIEISSVRGPVHAEIAALRDDGAVAIPLMNEQAVRLGDSARISSKPRLRPHASWRGRVIGPLGQPIDGAGPLRSGASLLDIERSSPPALSRRRVDQAVATGVHAIDIFSPLCIGQRIGIFAGSGVGKSTLLAMLANLPDATTVVVALVGERGREVREFLEDTLGGSRDRVVAVVATSDDSPMSRRLAPLTAMTVAEYFRDEGEHVLLIVDSLTRFAHAQRECALAAGEPPVARGYPPSVFRELAGLLERAGPGTARGGAITAVTAVLVDGDDHNDPVADAVRGIIDGHVVLDRKIAAQGRWPAIDILGSISRLAPKAWTREQREIADMARSLIARFEDTRDLRMIGGYQAGQDPMLDRAVGIVPAIYELLKQSPGRADADNPFAALAQLMRGKEATLPAQRISP